MSVLRQLHNKSPHPQTIRKIFATRFFATALKVNPEGCSDEEPVPDQPTSAYYDELINKAGQNGDLETIGYLLDKRSRDKCCNTAKTFEFLTNTESSLSFLDPLIETLSRLGKGRRYAFNMLIARLCKLERTDESLRVIDAMVKGGYGLNAITFHPIINTLTRKRKRKMKEAWRVVDLMRDAGVSPDITAYNFLLMAYCVEGELTEASAVLKKAEEEGLAADGRTFDALILGASKAGKLAGALALLRRMINLGFHVPYATPSHVITAMVKQGYFDQAVRFVMAFRGRDKGLDQGNFGLLASRLVGLRRNHEAMLVLGEMSKMGLEMSQKLSDFYQMNAKSKD